MLGLSMQSVGEAMAIGRTFNEALQKGLRSLEIGVAGLESQGFRGEKLIELLRTPTPERVFAIGDALREGMSVDEIYEISAIDRWFLREMREIVEMESVILSRADGEGSRVTNSEILRSAQDDVTRWKRNGFSDRQIATLTGRTETEVREERHRLGVRPVYKRVDTCAAEFEASTPYLYSTYETENEADPTTRRKVMILGSGPNRIGQGIEFDTCCVHASFALREIGFETIMLNCNPETRSPDYDTSDRHYFEPLTLEDVLEIVDLEKPEGVIVRFVGQTPLKLALDLEANGVPIVGTSPDMIDAAEDRERFQKLLQNLNLRQPPNRTARAEDEALRLAEEIGYPLVVRPSSVLGARPMEIVHDPPDLQPYIHQPLRVR